MVADLRWCRKNLEGMCEEVFLSHVLEHYSYPGKAYRDEASAVSGALSDIYGMLMSGGQIRIAVPDFRAIAKLYLENESPLYPRLLGRLYGEQDYRQNLHRCGFDRDFLQYCLKKAGFMNIREWSAGENGLQIDASFDEIDGVKTSLNLIAQKQ